ALGRNCSEIAAGAGAAAAARAFAPTAGRRRGPPWSVLAEHWGRRRPFRRRSSDRPCPRPAAPGLDPRGPDPVAGWRFIPRATCLRDWRELEAAGRHQGRYTIALNLPRPVVE